MNRPKRQLDATEHLSSVHDDVAVTTVNVTDTVLIYIKLVPHMDVDIEVTYKQIVDVTESAESPNPLGP